MRVLDLLRAELDDRYRSNLRTVAMASTSAIPLIRYAGILSFALALPITATTNEAPVSQVSTVQEIVVTA